MLPTSAGDEPATSWSPVGQRIQLSHRGRQVNHQPDKFLSPIFVFPKKDGEYRMILNLKELNQNTEYHHFKMYISESALKLIKPNCFMASVDLRHAYYSVPVAKKHQIKLIFVFHNTVYQYVSLPNGISCAPRLFTKLLKPVYASLQQMVSTI